MDIWFSSGTQKGYPVGLGQEFPGVPYQFWELVRLNGIPGA
jgi:hypothetical protein